MTIVTIIDVLIDKMTPEWQWMLSTMTIADFQNPSSLTGVALWKERPIHDCEEVWY